MDFSNIIRSELDRLPGNKKRNARYTFILCPFHSERTPSLRVWHDTGGFQCMGCRESGGWNTLAKKLGMQPVGSSAKVAESMDVGVTNLSRYEDALFDRKADEEELRFRKLTSAWVAEKNFFPSGKWRDFRLDFLEEKIQARLCTVVETRRSYVYLPIIIQQKLRGYIKAQIEKPTKKEIPSYINSKGSWSRRDGLFPYDSAVALMKELGLTTLVLVEGPRDALRLIRFGIPAVCIMGTHSWSKTKLRHLEFSGATRIVLMMDGDKAGRAATQLIRTGRRVKADGSEEVITPPLSEYFQVKTIRLWNVTLEDGSNPEYDPGNCPRSLLEQVKTLLR